MLTNKFPFYRSKRKLNISFFLMTVIILTGIAVIFACTAYGEESTGEIPPTLPPVYTPDPGSLATLSPTDKPIQTNEPLDLPEQQEFLWSDLVNYFSYACYFAAPIALLAGITVAVVRSVKNSRKSKQENEKRNESEKQPRAELQSGKKKKISSSEYFNLAETEWTDVTASDSKWTRKDDPNSASESVYEDNDGEEYSEEDFAALEEELKAAEEKDK